MSLSKQQLSEILDSVTNDLATLMKSEAEGELSLSKADPGEIAPGEEISEGSASESPAPGTDAPADIPPPAEQSAASPEVADSTPEAAPAPEDSGDPAEDQGVTPEVLQAEYSKLPPEEMKAHLMAVQAAYMAVMGGQKKPQENSESPDAGAAPAPAMKAEITPKNNGGEITKSLPKDIVVRLAKADNDSKEIEELRKSLKEQKSKAESLELSVGKLAEVVSKTINSPMRKSIKDVSSLGFTQKPGSEHNKNEEVLTMSKAEVLERLNEITARPLEKKDRDLVSRYCVNAVSVSAIAHLLK